MQMAMAAESLGLLDLAVWLLEQARQRDSQQIELNRALARLHEKRGNFSQAIPLWEMIRKAVPHDVEARHKGKDLSARETISRGRYEESAKPSTGESEKDTEEFTASDGTPIAPPPDRVSREAAPFLARIAKAPAEPVPYLELATVYSRAGQDDQARDILNKGLQATGSHFQIRIAIMERDLAALRGEFAATERQLRELPPSAESEAEEETELGSLHRRQTNEIAEREIALWRLKADHHPNEMSQRVELGMRLLRAGQIDAAIVELQIARRDKRQQWRAMMYLGYCFQSRRNQHLALRNFQDALDHLPASAEKHRKELLFQLATCQSEAGEIQAAIDTASELANLDFGYREIGKMLDEWQKRG
jgi:Tfp pilus assembly protein PilF